MMGKRPYIYITAHTSSFHQYNASHRSGELHLLVLDTPQREGCPSLNANLNLDLGARLDAAPVGLSSQYVDEGHESSALNKNLARSGLGCLREIRLYQREQTYHPDSALGRLTHH